ncbi:MAG: GAF domain-containing protein [Chloroflexi bacterium]|nr:GAF domain-containing protein [Chloroflexota bacterium]
MLDQASGQGTGAAVAASPQQDSDPGVLCRLVETAPWPTALIAPDGTIAALSRPAGLLIPMERGDTAAEVLFEGADVHERGRFEAFQARAQAGAAVDAIMIQRHAPPALEVDVAAIPGVAPGWLSVNLYRESRAAMMERVKSELNANMPGLLRAESVQTVCERVAGFLLPAGIGFTLYAQDNDNSIPPVIYSALSLEAGRIPPSAYRTVINQRAPLFLTPSSPDMAHSAIWAPGVRGHMVLPMPVTDQPQQLLHLWGSMVTAVEQHRLNVLAVHLGALLLAVAERERVTRRLQRLDALAAIAHVVASLGTVEEVLREVCLQAQRLLDMDHASIYLPADSEPVLLCAMSSGVAEFLLGSSLPLVGSLAGRSFREGATLAIADTEADPDTYRPSWETHRLRAAMFQPLRHQGAVIGVLTVARKEQTLFGDDERMMLDRFAELAAAAVANARLHNALRQSERRYRLLFEQAEELVFSLTPDGQIRRFNQAAAAVIASEQGAPIGKSIFELAAPADRAELRRRLDELLGHRRFDTPWNFEIQDAQGHTVVLEATGQVVWAGIQPVEIDLICRDVTARRAAAYELQRRQMELTTLLRVSQAMNRSSDLDQVLHAALEAIVLARLAHAAGVLLRDDDGRLRLHASYHVSPEHRFFVEEYREPPFAGELHALEGGAPVIIDAAMLQAAQPRVLDPGVFLTGSLAVIPLIVEGVAVGLLEIGTIAGAFDERDIKLAEAVAAQIAQAIANARVHQEMRETSIMNARLYREAEAMRAYLDAIIQNAPDMLLVCRPDMSMQPLNQEPLTTIGYQRQNLAGQSLLVLVPANRRNELIQYWLQARQGDPQRFEIDLLRADGDYFNALVSFDLIPDYDEVLVVVKDMTALRRLESQLRQSEKLAALGRMVAGAAHELNNPLAVVLGLSQLQLSEDLTPSLRADIEQIERAARRAASIVQQLRAFSRPQAPEPEPLNLGPLIGETLQRLAGEIATEGIDVAMDVPVDLVHVAGEAHQIEQVLFNITRNAVQALALCPPGAPRRLQVRAGAHPDGVVVTISDTGPGIAPEHLQHVFEPFFTTRDVGQGMGMGLAVVYSIVQQHGGDVWVESHPGEGTTFYVRLPLAQGARALSTKSASAVPPGLTVLLVEDEEVVRSVAQRALARLECRVDAVGRGEDALARAMASDYALIITDLQMPGMDGAELYARLHHLRPASRWLVLTGDTMGERSRAFLERTGLPVLHKPFTYEQLVESVAASLR